MSKWLHIIGIAGVTTAGLAVAYKSAGWKVTGSDKGFYPPVTDFLNKYDIPVMPGFKAERLTRAERHPDLVIYQGTKSPKNNEEIIEAKRLGLKLTTYTHILAKDVIKADSSIVITGSFGKTTTTALLNSIFTAVRIKHSYMYGAFSPELQPNVGFKDEDTQFSIVEGDEYLDSLENRRSKFFYYSPKYLIITGLEWDHQDLFPTFESYLENFRELIRSIPEDGLIVANGDDDHLAALLSSAKAKVIRCSIDLQTKADWYLIKESKPRKVIMKKGLNDEMLMIPYDRNFLGSYNDRNILYATALAYELAITKESIQKGIGEFKGLKRRLEIKWQNEDNMIIDDFGSTPAKLKTTLHELSKEFPNKSIYAIIDPAAGSRSIKALTEFRNHIEKNIKVILPRFSILPKSSEDRFSESDLCDLLRSEELDCEYIDQDEILIQSLKQIITTKNECIIIFLGSHSFRGMIDKLVSSLA